MKVRISREELQARKLYVATPMYGGQCFGFYTNSLLQLKTVMMQNDMRMDYFCLFNESRVTRARNFCVHEFLHSDCTHLLFIDADIEFSPDAVFSLLALADPKSDKDVVCGLYPKKHINWSKVATAVSRGITGDLSSYGSDLVFNTHGLDGSFNFYSPLEVTESGTGFMMIQRHVFDKFRECYPKEYFDSDGRESGRKPSKIGRYFSEAIKDGRDLSEDYHFCQLVRKIGMKVWVAPWIELNHLGHYKFIGNPLALSELAETAASAA
jgi:hypothetical protein